MSRAVHGLDGKFVLVHLELEHVFRVILPVARRLPQLRVEDVRRANLVEATLFVLVLCHSAKPMYAPRMSHTVMNCLSVLYIRVPIGSMKTLPGLSSWKNHSSCCFPIVR